MESEVDEGSAFTVRLQRGHTHLPIESVEHTPEDSSVNQHIRNRTLAVVDEAVSWRYDAAEPSPLEAGQALGERPPSGASASEDRDVGESSGSGTGDEFVNGAEILSLRNRTVVLIDDSRDLREYMSALLAKSFRVVEFGDPRAALTYIHETPPDLVLVGGPAQASRLHQLT